MWEKERRGNGLQWREENALSLNYGVEKLEEMKPRNLQEEGNGAKIGPESTWLPQTTLLLEAKAADTDLGRVTFC